jgi:predicted metal-dependent TIM-barrel fold hydrolase
MVDLENPNLPANAQNVDRIIDKEFYIQYLGDCVECGAISEEEAEEIIENEDWKKVEGLIDRGDSREEEDEN